MRLAPRSFDAPTTTYLAEPHRLLPPVTVDPAHRSTSYRFIGGPHGARWEACRPIHYVVRPGGEGAKFDAILRSSVAETSRASGLKFIDDGLTTEAPLAKALRDYYQPHELGDGAVRTVVLHELGHLVGLAHVHDRSQVMNPTVGRGAPSHFAAGDLTGLAELGTGPCFTDY